MRSGLRGLVPLALLLGLASAAQAESGSVRGRVVLDLADTSVALVGPVVVFLDAVEGELAFVTPREKVRIDQENATFTPSFRIVVKGQEVEMPNLDHIYHNAFSYSRPNDFDLGLYPAGESRSVRLEHAGIVKTYCAIHENMSLTIFVAPSPWVTRVLPSGEFVIRGVPPGRYMLHSWAERLPDHAQEIRVAGDTVEVEIRPLARAD
jgi:plastocyanin